MNTMTKHIQKLFQQSLPLILICCALGAPLVTHAQLEPEERAPDEYYIGVVIEVKPSAEQDTFLQDEILQDVTVFIKKGSGWEVEAQYSEDKTTEVDDLELGEKVVVLKTAVFAGETRYIVTDKYRIPSIVALLLIFFLSAVIFARKKGLTSILGLGISLLILLVYTVPSIVQGDPPFLVACISAFLIAVFSIWTAHGFSKQTGIAMISTLVALVLSLGLSQVFVSTAKLFGLGTEDAFSLTYAGLGNIDLRGLLLAGIIIGVLGVLDDVTTAQTAAVKQLASLGVHDFKELYRRGSAVGREHIVSLVNTLALAYVGSSLPLLMMFSLNEGRVPYWILLNSQIITEEIVRTLVGSVVLILAVPISTGCAAWFYARFPSIAHIGGAEHDHTHSG